MGSCPDTDIDPNRVKHLHDNQLLVRFERTLLWHNKVKVEKDLPKQVNHS